MPSDASQQSQAELSYVECQRLCRIYDLERYLFEEVTPRFARQEFLDSCDFYAIVIWKSNRTKTKVQEGLAQRQLTPASLTKKVYSSGDLEKIELLDDVPGIGLAMASAILTVCYPMVFTVLDYRVWKTLSQMNVEELPKSYPEDSKAYIQYCRCCHRLAKQLGVLCGTWIEHYGHGIGRRICYLWPGIEWGVLGESYGYGKGDHRGIA